MIFDITYQIEFEGCPGSQLEPYMGITTDTIRIELLPEVPRSIDVHPYGNGFEKLVVSIPLEAQLLGNSRHPLGILVIR